MLLNPKPLGPIKVGNHVVVEKGLRQKEPCTVAELHLGWGGPRSTPIFFCCWFFYICEV